MLGATAFFDASLIKSKTFCFFDVDVVDVLAFSVCISCFTFCNSFAIVTWKTFTSSTMLVRSASRLTTFTSATSQFLISVEIDLRITHAVHLTRLTDFFLDTGLFDNDALGVLGFSFLFDVAFGLRLRRHFKRAASGLAVQTCRLRVAPHPRHRGLERSKEFRFRLPVIKE